jgi:hypothetical protein
LVYVGVADAACMHLHEHLVMRKVRFARYSGMFGRVTSIP